VYGAPGGVQCAKCLWHHPPRPPRRPRWAAGMPPGAAPAKPSAVVPANVARGRSRWPPARGAATGGL